MNYQAISTESLKKKLKQKRIQLQWTKDSIPCKEIASITCKDIDKEISKIEAELRSRETHKAWI